MSAMYAIAFDLDTDMLNKTYHNGSYNNAYADIEKVFNLHGFKKQQGSMYFGSPESTAVDCTLAIMDITSAYDWFAPSVSDVRMLRVEDNNDLKPIIEKVSSMKK
jgi:virulence-associated protein VapD